MNDEWVDTISKRYIELYEKLIGEPFKPEKLSADEIYGRIENSLSKLMKEAH
jgi:phosphoribosylaminoimidazole-succinocarboxamide synthase